MRIATGQQEGEEQDGTKSTTGQATVPDESRADVSVHGFWNWSTTALFDMQIVNLYVGSYMRHTPENPLAMAEKELNDKYLQSCLDRPQNFTPIVYSADEITGTEAVAAQQYLALLLSNGLKP